MSVRVRFAPSPSGYLHVGNVRTALYNWLFACRKKGTFILRIEDTDVERSDKQYEEQLIDDLRWLGLEWHEGVAAGGGFGPYRQSERLSLYREYAERLLAEGRAYYCFCSSEELEEQRQRQLDAGEQPRYSGKCRAIPRQEAEGRRKSGESAALRLKVREGAITFQDVVFGPVRVDSAVIGDFILLRSDGSAQYNFAVVIDDLLMEITYVIRGEGHLSNTPRQVLVYEALGLQPPQFAHLSTILGKDGAKLSKRHGATSIQEFRQQGYLPEALLNYLALLGWAPREEGKEVLSPQQLIAEFDLFSVNRSPAVFDPDKLNWVNRAHLKRVEQERLIDLALPYLRSAGLIGETASPEIREWVGRVVDAVLNYLDKLEDLTRETRLIFQFEPARDLAGPEVQQVLAADGARAVMQAFFEQIRPYESLDLETYKQAVAAVREATGQKGKNLFHPIRVALTGRSSGPELEKLIPVFEHGKHLDLPVKVLGARERVATVLEMLAKS